MKSLDEIMGNNSESTEEKPVTAETKDNLPAEQPEIDDTQDEATDQAPQPKSPRRVPINALHEARREAKEAKERAEAIERQFNDFRNQAFERMAAALPRQPEPEAPDFFSDPDQAIAHRLTPYQQQMQDMQRKLLKAEASIEFGGSKEIDEAYSAAMQRLQRGDPAMRMIEAQVMASPNPFVALVNWHRLEKQREKYGENPEEYINKQVEERLAQRLAETQQNPAVNPTRLPGNFATGRSSSPRGPSVPGTGPRPLSDIMKR